MLVAWLAKSGQGVTGPNGNEIVGYEWKHRVEEVPSKREGSAARKVSDWSRAEKCADCGRNIVHVFWVLVKETGKTEPYGSDHIHLALGYPKPLGRSQIDKITQKLPSKEKLDAEAGQWEKWVESEKAASMGEALRKFAKRNPQNWGSLTKLRYEKDGFIILAAGDKELWDLRLPGWEFVRAIEPIQANQESSDFFSWKNAQVFDRDAEEMDEEDDQWDTILTQKKKQKNFLHPSESGEIEEALTIKKINWVEPTESQLKDEFHEADVDYLLLGGGYPRPGEREAAFDFFKNNLYQKEIDPSTLAKDNSFRFDFDDYASFKKQVTSYGGPKDPDSMIRKIQAGGGLPMPVVIHKRDGSYLLVGGATRVSIAKLAGQNVSALVIDEDVAKKWRAEKVMRGIEEYIKDNPEVQELWEKLQEYVATKGRTAHLWKKFDKETYGFHAMLLGIKYENYLDLMGVPTQLDLENLDDKLGESVESDEASVEMTTDDVNHFASEVISRVFNNEFKVPGIEYKTDTRGSWIARAGAHYGKKSDRNEYPIDWYIEIQRRAFQNPEVLKSAIAHELIHIWQYLNTPLSELKLKDAHDGDFKEWAAKINSVYGSGFVDKFGSWKDTKSKEFYVAIEPASKGGFVYFNFIRPSQSLKDELKRRRERGRDIRVVKTSDDQWLRGEPFRKFQIKMSYPIEPERQELLKQMFNSGEYFFSESDSSWMNESKDREEILSMLRQFAEMGINFSDYVSPDYATFRRSLKQKLKDYLKKNELRKGFVRGTRDKNEIARIKDGTIRPSKNHITGEYEKGLSVSKSTATVWAYAYPFWYLIDGDVVGTGSDGEPVLDVKTLKVLSPLHKFTTGLPNEKKTSAELRKLAVDSGYDFDVITKLFYESLDNAESYVADLYLNAPEALPDLVEDEQGDDVVREIDDLKLIYIEEQRENSDFFSWKKAQVFSTNADEMSEEGDEQWGLLIDREMKTLENFYYRKKGSGSSFSDLVKSNIKESLPHLTGALTTNHRLFQHLFEQWGRNPSYSTFRAFLQNPSLSNLEPIFSQNYEDGTDAYVRAKVDNSSLRLILRCRCHGGCLCFDGVGFFDYEKGHTYKDVVNFIESGSYEFLEDNYPTAIKSEDLPYEKGSGVVGIAVARKVREMASETFSRMMHGDKEVPVEGMVKRIVDDAKGRIDVTSILPPSQTRRWHQGEFTEFDYHVVVRPENMDALIADVKGLVQGLRYQPLPKKDTIDEVKAYHGTNRVFREFDPQASTRNDTVYGKGTYFSASPVTASDYAGDEEGANVHMVEIDTDKYWFWDVSNYEEYRDIAQFFGYQPVEKKAEANWFFVLARQIEQDPEMEDVFEYSDYIAKGLRKMLYAGVMVPKRWATGKEAADMYVVYDLKAIKPRFEESDFFSWKKAQVFARNADEMDKEGGRVWLPKSKDKKFLTGCYLRKANANLSQTMERKNIYESLGSLKGIYNLNQSRLLHHLHDKLSNHKSFFALSGYLKNPKLDNLKPLFSSSFKDDEQFYLRARVDDSSIRLIFSGFSYGGYLYLESMAIFDYESGDTYEDLKSKIETGSVGFFFEYQTSHQPRSPSKHLSLPFLRFLQQNNYQTETGIEYVQDEVDELIAQKLSKPFHEPIKRGTTAEMQEVDEDTFFETLGEHPDFRVEKEKGLLRIYDPFGDLVMKMEMVDGGIKYFSAQFGFSEAEHQGKEVSLNKPTRGDVKKYKVFVKDPKTGRVKKVNFGDPNMEIKRDDPERRRSFRARHKCDTAKDKTTPRYWSCRFWDKKPVSKMVEDEFVETVQSEREIRWLADAVLNALFSVIKRQKSFNGVATSTGQFRDLREWDEIKDFMNEWNVSVVIAERAGEDILGSWVRSSKTVFLSKPDSSEKLTIKPMADNKLQIALGDAIQNGSWDAFKKKMYFVYDDVLVHELTHAFDDFRSKGKFKKDTYKADGSKDYWLDQIEINARFAETSKRMLRKKLSLDTGHGFEEYVRVFKQEIGSWDDMPEWVQKRLLGRMSKEYSDLSIDEKNRLLVRESYANLNDSIQKLAKGDGVLPEEILWASADSRLRNDKAYNQDQIRTLGKILADASRNPEKYEKDDLRWARYLLDTIQSAINNRSESRDIIQRYFSFSDEDMDNISKLEAWWESTEMKEDVVYSDSDEEIPDDIFDTEQLSLGFETEIRRVKDKDEAMMIAKDNLLQDPDYYSKRMDESMANSEEVILALGKKSYTVYHQVDQTDTMDDEDLMYYSYIVKYFMDDGSFQYEIKEVARYDVESDRWIEVDEQSALTAFDRWFQQNSSRLQKSWEAGTHDIY